MIKIGIAIYNLDRIVRLSFATIWNGNIPNTFALLGRDHIFNYVPRHRNSISYFPQIKTEEPQQCELGAPLLRLEVCVVQLIPDRSRGVPGPRALERRPRRS